MPNKIAIKNNYSILIYLPSSFDYVVDNQVIFAVFQSSCHYLLYCLSITIKTHPVKGLAQGESKQAACRFDFQHALNQVQKL